MLDGMYRIEFETHLGSGSGVAALHGGIVGGGDRRLAYRGAYTLEGDWFAAEVEIAPHGDAGRTRSVFGVSKARVSLRGHMAGGRASLMGTSPAAPGVVFRAEMSRLPD